MSENEFVDLIYCSDGFAGREILAIAPLDAYIKKGDLIRIKGDGYYYTVACTASVSKSSEIYKLLTEAFIGNIHKVTDKYSHQEIGGSENE